MKACVNTEYGPPEVVKVLEVEKPIYKEDQVLIKIHASTVNRTDCGFRSAEYFISRFFSGLLKPKFKSLGCEFAGEIEAIGEKVTLFKPGQKVFGFEEKNFGAHAEYLVISENSTIATIPDFMTYIEAAPILEGSHYALCDIRAAKVKAGQNVLVNGGTGAIGSAAIQLLKNSGAIVTAVCSTEHLELIKSIGADRVIDYRKEDFTLQTEKYDFIFDAVGKSSFRKCKPLLKQKGIYISTELGYKGANIYLALFTPILFGKRVLFPIPTINKEDVLFIKDLVEKRKFKPLIDKIYPMDEIVEAYKYVESGMKVGNVVLEIVM